MSARFIKSAPLLPLLFLCTALFARNPLPGRAVPDASRAPECMHLADVLYTSGRRPEALWLWKSVLAMDRFRKGETPGFLRRSAREAVRRRNLYARERSEYARVNFETDPYAFFDAGETTVLVDRFALRIRIPGSWLWHGTGHPGEGLAFTLARGDFSLFAGAESLSKSLRLEEYVRLWDERRALGPQRKIRLRFTRRPHGESPRLCVEKDCAWFQAEIDGSRWLEFFRARGREAFFLRLNHAPASTPEAETLMKNILQNIHFGE